MLLVFFHFFPLYHCIYCLFIYFKLFSPRKLRSLFVGQEELFIGWEEIK